MLFQTGTADYSNMSVLASRADTSQKFLLSSWLFDTSRDHHRLTCRLLTSYRPALVCLVFFLHQWYEVIQMQHIPYSKVAMILLSPFHEMVGRDKSPTLSCLVKTSHTSTLWQRTNPYAFG